MKVRVTKSQTTCSRILMSIIMSGCGTKGNITPSTPLVPIKEQIPASAQNPQSTASETRGVGHFLRSEAAKNKDANRVVNKERTVSADSGQTLLIGDDGEIALVGITQSSLKDQAPSETGDLFFAMYAPNSVYGIENNGTQLPVEAPIALFNNPLLPSDINNGKPIMLVNNTLNLSQAQIDVKGGRLFSTLRQSLVLGNMGSGASRFTNGPATSGMNKIFAVKFVNDGNEWRDTWYLGNDGGLAQIGATTKALSPESVLIVGTTTLGLDAANASAGVFLAELTNTALVKNFVIVPISPDVMPKDMAQLGIGSVLNNETNSRTNSIVVASKNDDKKYVNLYPYVEKKAHFSQKFSPDAPVSVCQTASELTTGARFASLDMRENLLVVAVELPKPNAVRAILDKDSVDICIETFDITSSGGLKSRESQVLNDMHNVSGSIKINVTFENKILLSRSRYIVDANGGHVEVFQSLYDKLEDPGSQKKSAIPEKKWNALKPIFPTQSNSVSVNDTQRILQSIVFGQSNMWIVTNNLRKIPDAFGQIESRVHIAPFVP